MSVTGYLEPPELPCFFGAGFFAGAGAAFTGTAGAAGVCTATVGVVFFFFFAIVAVGVGAVTVDDVSVVADSAAFANADAS